jgi:hypothetical protein
LADPARCDPLSNLERPRETRPMTNRSGHCFMRAMKSLLDQHGEQGDTPQEHPEMLKCHKALGKACTKACAKAYPDLHKELGWTEKDFADDTSNGQGGTDKKDFENDMSVEKDFTDDIADDAEVEAVERAEKAFERLTGRRP